LETVKFRHIVGRTVLATLLSVGVVAATLSLALAGELVVYVPPSPVHYAPPAPALVKMGPSFGNIAPTVEAPSLTSDFAHRASAEK
jgi:hypothetical protein